MPFVDGVFVPEEQDVSTRVSGLIAADSPFIRAAGTRARQAANRRGLLNTSIAVQAGERAAQEAALPIAAQEAAQIAGQNLSFQEAQQAGTFQEAEFGQETAENIARRAFETSEAALGRTFTAGETELARESTETLAAQEITARRGLLETELASRERVAGSELEFLSAQNDLAREADVRLTDMGIISNETLGNLDAETRINLSNLSAENQQRIEAMRVDAANQQTAMNAAVQFANQYENALANIDAIPDISADARDALRVNAAFVRDSNFDMITQLYNVQLSWQSPVAGVTGGTVTAGGTPPGTPPPDSTPPTVTTPPPPATTLSDPPANTTQVTQFYSDILGRSDANLQDPAVQANIALWVNMGMKAHEVALAIYNSPEAQLARAG